LTFAGVSFEVYPFVKSLKHGASAQRRRNKSV